MLRVVSSRALKGPGGEKTEPTTLEIKVHIKGGGEGGHRIERKRARGRRELNGKRTRRKDPWGGDTIEGFSITEMRWDLNNLQLEKSPSKINRREKWSLGSLG